MSDREMVEDNSESGVNISTYGRIDFVNTKTRVHVCEWGDRWSDPRCRKCCLSADACCVVGVENLCIPYERI